MRIFVCRIVAKSISKERGNMKLVLSFKLPAGGRRMVRIIITDSET